MKATINVCTMTDLTCEQAPWRKRAKRNIWQASLAGFFFFFFSHFSPLKAWSQAMSDLKYPFYHTGDWKECDWFTLDSITEIPDESQAIAGITKLNNFELSSSYSVTCWPDYCIVRRKTIKLDKSSSSKELYNFDSKVADI